MAFNQMASSGIGSGLWFGTRPARGETRQEILRFLHDNNVLNRSPEAPGVGWSRNTRNTLYSGFGILLRSDSRLFDI